ncbi:MAG: helix-turn-helix domain-containing protein [Lachnospiraceae bacterium]
MGVINVYGKQFKGCGAIDYFNQMKIERAKEIIKDEKMNFTGLAHYLSYGSLQYFSKQFKKATGMSPLEYSTSVKDITNAVKCAAPRIISQNHPDEFRADNN